MIVEFIDQMRARGYAVESVIRVLREQRAGAVAVSDTLRGTFEGGRSDERGRLRVDEFLVERFGRSSDSVGDIGEFQFPEELEEGRLV